MIFSSSRDGNRHLWTARLDGRDTRPLTSGVSLDAWPSLSPDGQQIAFVSDRSGQRAIWLINPEGGAPRKLADVAPLGRLNWSSDSRELLYSAGAGDWPGLWAVSVADGRIRRVPTTGAASEPAPNPTRDVIAYLSPSTSGPSNVSIEFINALGQPLDIRMPEAPAAGFASGLLAWSPDGRKLAVVRQPTNTEASIWVVEPDTVEPIPQTHRLPARATRPWPRVDTRWFRTHRWQTRNQQRHRPIRPNPVGPEVSCGGPTARTLVKSSEPQENVVQIGEGLARQ